MCEVTNYSETIGNVGNNDDTKFHVDNATTPGVFANKMPNFNTTDEVLCDRNITLGGVFDDICMIYQGVEKMTKPIINFMGKHPYVTQLLLSGAVYSVNPVSALQMLIKTAGNAITNEILLKGYAGGDFKEQPIQTKAKSTAVITGLQTVVADLNEVGNDKIIRNAWNNVFNATLDILTNDVSAVKNLANDHPVIAQCITTGLSIASNIAVGKYTQSMPVACAKSALSLCTGIFSSKFGTSIFSELKKFIGYGKSDVPSEQITSQTSVDHKKVE